MVAKRVKGKNATTVPKRLKPYWKAAERAGWTYDETSDGHPRFTPPEGTMDPYRNRLAAPVTFGRTPSDYNGDRNAVAYLRRVGIEIPHRGHTPKKEERK